MPIEPKIPKRQFLTKTCTECGRVLEVDDFAPSKSIFYKDGRSPICNDCIENYLRANEYKWATIDKLCQWLDIPFIVKEWTRIQDLNPEQPVWGIYSKVFADEAYESLGWEDYHKQYLRLRETGTIDEEIPLVRDKKIQDLRHKWGANYDETELRYLEELYKSLLVTQNVNGGLQEDQARKICKLSLEIDNRIRAGDKEVDKFLSSYDKLVKTAEFTPKNARNVVDFDSFAEVGRWLEKRGRQNKFYDGATRDVIDETLKNIENYNQRLYINEGGIGDEITQRLKMLENTKNMEENYFDLQKEFNLDEYDNQGFNVDLENEEFVADYEDDEEDKDNE